VLIIGKEVKELKQFKLIYKITDRQSEIIQKIISGDSNRLIAENLGITESTIKGHITNIYDKLGIYNKMQLFNLLKEYNLIPEQPSEKTILFFAKN
jgi:DNA-binding NarL/FixJ family response regulator